MAGPINRKRLNAPVGYRWTDEDVLHEKTMSFLNGMMVGLWLCAAIAFLLVVI